MVLPETYAGDKDLEQWIYHFENVVAVNEWTDDAKLLWLKVQLTGWAQTAFQRFPDEAKATCATAKKALKQCFEPPSKQDQYQAEFQAHR